MERIGGHLSAPADAQTIRDRRLQAAAHEFEAQMMKELLAPMTGSEDADEDLAGSAGPLGAFASEALGRALSEHGGLGIANAIVANLSQTGNHSEKGARSGKMQQSTTFGQSE